MTTAAAGIAAAVGTDSATVQRLFAALTDDDLKTVSRLM
jgi:hypothetical protein